MSPAIRFLFLFLSTNYAVIEISWLIPVIKCNSMYKVIEFKTGTIYRQLIHFIFEQNESIYKFHFSQLIIKGI